MNRKRANLSVLGTLLFFASIAVTVTVALLTYGFVDERTGGDKKVVVIVMLFVVVFLSILWTVADVIRRRVMVDKPVEQILLTTEKIAAGDFSVRLQQRHGYAEYDEYDCIMENLNLMAEALGKSEVLKTDFISNVSHELKTPLSVIKSYALLLQTEQDEEKRREYSDVLLKASSNLSELVTNILRLSKLENDKIKPQADYFRLEEVVANAVIGLEDKIEKKKIEVACDLDEVELYSAQIYWEIVVNNLVSNAVKFTDEGGRVAITLKNEDGMIVVKVTDTGCGISPETGKRIFDKFYQGDASHAQEGNGLGLALVKKVVEILGAKISVESELGKGSTFAVAWRINVE